MFKEIDKADFIMKVKIRFYNIEDGFEKFKNNILSVNSDKLNLFEEKQKIKKNKFKNEYEENFISFIQDAYKINDNKGVIIDFYINNLDDIAINNILEALDEEEGGLFLNIIHEMTGSTNYFKVDNEEILSLIVKLNAREIFFSTFYFLDKEFTVWGNYNMEFPVFYNDDQIIEKYKKIASENNLYIR